MMMMMLELFSKTQLILFEKWALGNNNNKKVDDTSFVKQDENRNTGKSIISLRIYLDLGFHLLLKIGFISLKIFLFFF